MHKTAGYINVTRLCKVHGKQFKNWFANKSVKCLIDGLAEKLTISPNQMLVTIEGGSGTSKKDICGTYAHPVLLPHIASWIDHVFAAIASIIVNNFFQLQTKTCNFDVLLQDEKLKKDSMEEQEGGDDDNSDPSIEESRKALKIFKRLDDKYPYQAFEVTQKGMAAAVKGVCTCR